MALNVVEYSVRSRLGPPEFSADLVLVAPHLIAVISGVSFAEPDATLPRGQTPARYAATVGLAGLRALDPLATLPEAVSALTGGLNDALQRVQPKGERLRVGYAFAAISNLRREVWQVGNVSALSAPPTSLGEPGRPNILPSLLAAAQARSLILNALLARTGPAVQARDLLVNDPSRPMISTLLVAHAALANAAGPLGYAVIDGQAVPPGLLRVHPLPPGSCEVSLCTGGYPTLHHTLAASERHLQHVLEDDPLLISRFPYVRPVRPGHAGYADRAYVRARVW